MASCDRRHRDFLLYLPGILRSCPSYLNDQMRQTWLQCWTAIDQYFGQRPLQTGVVVPVLPLAHPAQTDSRSSTQTKEHRLLELRIAVVGLFSFRTFAWIDLSQSESMYRTGNCSTELSKHGNVSVESKVLQQKKQDSPAYLTCHSPGRCHEPLETGKFSPIPILNSKSTRHKSLFQQVFFNTHVTFYPVLAASEFERGRTELSDEFDVCSRLRNLFCQPGEYIS